MKNGVITESNKEYHGYTEAISKSRLSLFSVCPAYFKWAEDNPSEPTEDLIVGSAFHKLVLEPDDFDKEYAVLPMGVDRRTKAGREVYDAFIQEAGERQIITQEQFDTISAMRDSVFSNKYSSALLKGEHEKSMYSVDELTQEAIKTRPDCYRMAGERLIITDLKSCKSALPEDFCRDVVKFKYDLQAYMYSNNASKILNIPMENIDFVFIAVEKKPPYLINITQADEYVLQRGEALFRDYIGTYHECKTTGEWWGLNGKSGLINNLTLPSWLMKEVNNE